MERASTRRAPRSDDLDGLLEPSLDDRAERPSALPWRLSGHVYVVFFGGVVAATVLSLVNAGRLGLPNRSRLLIVLCGVLGLAAVVVVASALDNGGQLSFFLRVVGLVAWAPMWWLQRTPDRVWSYRYRDEAFESLILPGIGLAIVGIFVQGAVTGGAG